MNKKEKETPHGQARDFSNKLSGKIICPKYRLVDLVWLLNLYIKWNWLIFQKIYSGTIYIFLLNHLRSLRYEKYSSVLL